MDERQVRLADVEWMQERITEALIDQTVFVKAEIAKLSRRIVNLEDRIQELEEAAQ